MDLRHWSLSLNKVTWDDHTLEWCYPDRFSDEKQYAWYWCHKDGYRDAGPFDTQEEAYQWASKLNG